MKRIWSVTLRSFGFLLATVFLLLGGVSVSYAQSSDKTLVVAVSRDLQNIDPTMTTGNIFTWEFLTNVYDWLIDYEVVDVGGGKLVGDSTSFIGGLAELGVERRWYRGYLPSQGGDEVLQWRPLGRRSGQVHF